jgi:hypothetical protein
MKTLMVALMIWISAQTGYQVNTPPPQIVFTTPKRVAEVCAQGALTTRVSQACYKLHEHTIYMRDDFNVENVEAMGVMVHELTHVLQLANGHKYTRTTMHYLEEEAEAIEAYFENSSRVQAQIAGTYAQAAPRFQPMERPEVYEPVVTPSPAVYYGIHLESYSTQAKADNAAARLQRIYGGILGPKPLTVRRVDLGSQGVVFRVLAGPWSQRNRALEIAEALRRTDQYAQVLRFN